MTSKKKKSPARSSKKKKTPKQVAADKLFQSVITTIPTPTSDNLALAHAMQTLRIYEIRKSREAEIELTNIERICREKFLRIMIDEMMESNNLRVMDISMIFNILSTEFSTLPLWENENAALIDEVIMEFVTDENDENDMNKNTKTAENVFNALGGLHVPEEGEEENER